MPQTVQLAGNGIGGVVTGAFGIYQQGTDGTFTVDTRDVHTLLSLGMSYIRKNNSLYSTSPNAPAAASATAYIASTTLSNGAVVFAAQPDVMRPASLVISQIGSPGPSAGTVAFTYVANDGTNQTDTFQLNAASVAAHATFATTKGVAHFTNGVVAGLVGSGFVTLGSTVALSVPVVPNSVDVTFLKENIDTGDEAIGTVSVSTLASIAPTTPPNTTHTYSFNYSYIAPEI